MRSSAPVTSFSEVTTVDRDQLLASAKDFADRALKAYTEDDTRVILTNAAFSLEHLSKAYLYSLHPALLMEIKNGQLDSLLHLVDLGTKARKAQFARTISAKEALARVEHVLPTLNAPKALLAQLIDIRDGVVHVGYLSGTSAREILTAFLRYSNELYDELRVDEGLRWGAHSHLVGSLISQSLTDIEHEVNRKLAAAKHRFDKLMEQIPEDERDRIRHARGIQSVASVHLFGDETRMEFTGCPVCDAEHAAYMGSIDVEWETDSEFGDNGDIVILGVLGTKTFHARRLNCGVCGLSLSSPDELRTAKLRTTWQLDEIPEYGNYPYTKHALSE